jgi:hypothetical protein
LFAAGLSREFKNFETPNGVCVCSHLILQE